MTEVNTALVDGHFRKGGKFIPTLHFRRNFAHEIMENTIGGDTVDSGSPRRSTRTPSIVAYTLLKVKKHEGSTIERQKIQKSKTGISKTEMRQL